MLLKNVQRSISSDSVGYIIDTIDENYQRLSNTNNHKLKSNTKRENKTFLTSNLLPMEMFEDISDENLHEIILSYYYCCEILPLDYFIPFLENKRVQDKIINTLLIICKNPFSL